MKKTTKLFIATIAAYIAVYAVTSIIQAVFNAFIY